MAIVESRTTAEKLALFGRLFAGRTDVYGTYDPVRGHVRQVKAPVTDEVRLAHLQGRQPYGVYLLMHDRTRAVVVDFDTGDLHPVLEFEAAAAQYGLDAYIERSKAKGHHVWIFFHGAILAAKARRVVGHILEEIHEPRTEVFPKQDALSNHGAYGNFINAPLFGAHVPHGRTVFVDPRNPTQPHSDQWTLLAGVRRVREKTLDEIIELNGLTTRVHGPSPVDNSARPPERTFGLPPCARRMLEEGVTSYQRVACFRLAVQLKRAGLPYDVAVAALSAWAAKNRPAAPKRVITGAEVCAQAAAAYKKNYRGCGCEDPAITPFCDLRCPVKADHQVTNGASRGDRKTHAAAMTDRPKLEVV